MHKFEKQQDEIIRWWALYLDDQDCVGKIQLCMNLSMSSNNYGSEKVGFLSSFIAPNPSNTALILCHLCVLRKNFVISLQQMLQGGLAVDTIIYDMVLEAAMRAQKFSSKMLHITGPWIWLLDEFSDYYGVSDAYRKLR